MLRLVTPVLDPFDLTPPGSKLGPSAGPHEAVSRPLHAAFDRFQQETGLTIIQPAEQGQGRIEIGGDLPNQGDPVPASRENREFFRCGAEHGDDLIRPAPRLPVGADSPGTLPEPASTLDRGSGVEAKAPGNLSCTQTLPDVKKVRDKALAARQNRGASRFSVPPIFSPGAATPSPTPSSVTSTRNEGLRLRWALNPSATSQQRQLEV